MRITAPVDKNSHVVLVDGSGYIFRAYHALPPLTRKSDGMPIGAVAGFSNMIFKLLRDQNNEDRPTHFAVIFDKGSHTFRNDIYDEYKANRSETPEDLIPQFPLTREATRAFGAPAIEMEGYEADDIIATYARQAEAKGARVTIISSDKDLMQLVSNKISMLDTMKNKKISIPQVIEKFGLPPERVIEIQALAGDSVDNIPGVPGIGVKTAVVLLEQFGDLETLLQRCDEIPQKGRREKMMANIDNARISLELVTLKTDVELEFPLEDTAVTDPDISVLFDFLEEMQFNTLTNRVRLALGEGKTGGIRKDDSQPNFITPGSITSPKNISFDLTKYECIQSEELLEKWIHRCLDAEVIAVDLETNSLDSSSADLVGICLSINDNDAGYVPLGHIGTGDMFG
ncbi:MAG: 5'-3' exonuclease H3TH domain-containing protein, partial [Hellea sp.]|nr:5'-3' exonuclease H3TH domain-containing protein [Hellea sp.]